LMAGARGARTRPNHPRLGAAAGTLALRLTDRYYSNRQIHRPVSAVTLERLSSVRAELNQGATVFLVGIRQAARTIQA
jgi:hypothetical protein